MSTSAAASAPLVASPDEPLGRALRMVTFRLARRLRAEKADDGLSDGQFAVLSALFVDGPRTLGALADREKVSAPSMNRTVNCLEEAGYVMRESDVDDRRKVNISLSDSGTTVVTETVARRDAWLDGVLDGLDESERETLVRAAHILGGLATR